MNAMPPTLLITILIVNLVAAQENPGLETSEVEKQLKANVVVLADDIGERNLTKFKALNQSADWIEKNLKEFGYQVSRQKFKVRNLDCHNIIAEKKGISQPKKIIIVGAHYDSVEGTPGANDNGSGTACLMVLADRFKKLKTDYTLRFVAFTNEEPPYFQQEDQMGSWVYARKCRKDNDNIVGVISLETMGYFSNAPNSQNYPPPISSEYPTTGNFIGFVSDTKSGVFARKCFKAFKSHSMVPAEIACLPGTIPGVGWSDHWSFWQEGFAGLMITDTAPFRYPHYHKATDTPDKIDYATLANVVLGLEAVIKEISSSADKDK